MPLTDLSGAGSRRQRNERWARETRSEPVVTPRDRVHRLDHTLTDELRGWTVYRDHGALHRDARYLRRRDEVERILKGHEWDLRAATATSTARGGRLRVLCWNVERGKRWQALRGLMTEHREFADLDVVLLCEVDNGLGRSDNRNVAAELAEHLGMGHVFTPSHLVLGKGDPAELDHGAPNTRAMHGVAVLSRFPVLALRGVGLPEFGDKLRSVEQRLGSKRALWVHLDTPGAPLSVCVTHLDPFATPGHRGRQMRLVLDKGRAVAGPHMLIGGDFNTNTYRLGSVANLAFDITHKLVRFGVEGTVRQYMTPQRVFERPLFRALTQAGLTTEGFVDPTVGTLRFDLNDPELLDKVSRALPGPALRWLMRKLEPWGGTVPMHIDWFAGKGLQPERAWTISRPRYLGGHVSDHDPVGVELRWPPRTG